LAALAMRDGSLHEVNIGSSHLPATAGGRGRRRAHEQLAAERQAGVWPSMSEYPGIRR
jgi:hypothetical protein